MPSAEARWLGFNQSGGRAKIGNAALRNFNSYYAGTKTAPVISDEKYKDAIVKQANKDAAAGIFQPQSQDFMDLKNSYINAAAPDKETGIANALKKFFGKGGSRVAEKNQFMNLVNRLLSGKPSSPESSAGNGQSHIKLTVAEKAREEKFLRIYNSAWNAWQAEHKGNAPRPEGALDITL
jgi:hypothetical protein